MRVSPAWLRDEPRTTGEHGTEPSRRTWGSWMSRNIGREDRLIRACVALSLLLMGGFAVAASGGFGAATIGFAILGGYFVLTAGVGWDPLYARLQMDTHAEPREPAWGDSRDPDPSGPELATPVPPLEIDLRDPRPAREGQAGILGDS